MMEGKYISIPLCTNTKCFICPYISTSIIYKGLPLHKHESYLPDLNIISDPLDMVKLFYFLFCFSCSFYFLSGSTIIPFSSLVVHAISQHIHLFPGDQYCPEDRISRYRNTEGFYRCFYP